MNRSLHIVLFTVLVCWLADAGGQTNTEPRHQVGFNFMWLGAKFLRIENSPQIKAHPYLLSYKFITKKNLAYRFGLGGEYSKRGPNGSNTSKIDTLNRNVFLRMGVEKRFNLGKSWRFLAGGDLRFGHENQRVKIPLPNGTPEEYYYANSRSTHIGLAPVMGIEMIISPYISLVTETALVYTYNTRFKEQGDTRYPVFNEKSSANFNKISVSLPLNLYITIKL
ncbi:MAG TPA: hypothetical protein VEC12_02185 [Bacteroidia bacterium]|nr:hypothetical protein [Bacteroidia bacterium]